MKKLTKPQNSGKRLAKPKSLTKVAQPVPQKTKALKKVTPAAEPLKKQLVKKELPPPKPKSGPVPVVPKKFKWNGKKDKHKQGSNVLVHPDDMPESFPRPHALTPPNTFWRVDKKTGVVDSLITILPDGVHTSWDDCYNCGNSARRCICRNGFIHSRGVEWVYIRSKMAVDGLTLAVTGPRIDSTGFDVTSRALYHYKGRETGRVPTGEVPRRPVAGSGVVQVPQTPAKPADRPTAPRKALKKSTTKAAPLKKAEPVEPLDLSKLNKDAASAADALAAEVEKALTKKPVKRLKKKG